MRLTLTLSMTAMALWVACAAQVCGEPLRLETRPIDLHTEDPAVGWVGALRYRGGLDIRSDNPRFGGLSGLLVDADGARIQAVSDKGYWVSAALHYDEDGRLASLGAARIGPLGSAEGRAVAGKRRADAESLARVDDGLLVAYEGRHRILRFPLGHGALARRPRRLDVPADLRRAPRNGAIEALTPLRGGGLLAIAETFAADERHVRAWLRDRRGWHRLGYRRHGQFFPTGATTIPGGDILVLERRFTWLGGIASRIVRLAADDVRPGAVLIGREIAVLDPPFVVENFEGIAARAGRDGVTLVYIISDDNFHALQRNLLLMFALQP